MQHRCVPGVCDWGRENRERSGKKVCMQRRKIEEKKEWKRERKEPHSTITTRNPKNMSSVCFIHSLKKSCCVLFFQPFFSPPPWSVRLALAHPHKPSHHSAHLCQTLQTPPQTQTDPANQSVCVCVCGWGVYVSSHWGRRLNISTSLMHKSLHVAWIFSPIKI